MKWTAVNFNSTYFLEILVRLEIRVGLMLSQKIVQIKVQVVVGSIVQALILELGPDVARARARAAQYRFKHRQSFSVGVKP